MDGAKLAAVAAEIVAQAAAKDAFGRQGIQSFVVEGVLAELQVRALPTGLQQSASVRLALQAMKRVSSVMITRCARSQASCINACPMCAGTARLTAQVRGASTTLQLKSARSWKVDQTAAHRLPVLIT